MMTFEEMLADLESALEERDLVNALKSRLHDDIDINLVNAIQDFLINYAKEKGPLRTGVVLASLTTLVGQNLGMAYEKKEDKVCPMAEAMGAMLHDHAHAYISITSGRSTKTQNAPSSCEKH